MRPSVALDRDRKTKILVQADLKVENSDLFRKVTGDFDEKLTELRTPASKLSLQRSSAGSPPSQRPGRISAGPHPELV